MTTHGDITADGPIMESKATVGDFTTQVADMTNNINNLVFPGEEDKGHPLVFSCKQRRVSKFNFKQSERRHDKPTSMYIGADGQRKFNRL